METLADTLLPAGWQGAVSTTRSLGDAWVRSGRSLVLDVPSAVVPGERNLLINFLHPDLPNITVGQPLKDFFYEQLTALI